MILGRESEVNYLNMHFDQDDSRIMVVYGEKNVGKTALLHQFVRDKSFYYYCAKYVSLREQRYQWGAELKKKRNPFARVSGIYRHFQISYGK